MALAIAPAHLALILTVVLVWAYNFIAAKVALAELSPLLLTALRFAIVGAVLLPFVPRGASAFNPGNRTTYLLLTLVGAGFRISYRSSTIGRYRCQITR